MINEFSQRAAECLRLARRTHSQHDKDLFEAMARAFAGETIAEEEKKEEAARATPLHGSLLRFKRPRPRRSAPAALREKQSRGGSRASLSSSGCYR